MSLFLSPKFFHANPTTLENETIISCNTECILSLNMANGARADQNIYKTMKFWESMMLVLDSRCNMRSKYGDFFNILIHHNWQNCEIDTTRRDAITMTPNPTLPGSIIQVRIPYLCHIPWIMTSCWCDIVQSLLNLTLSLQRLNQ